MQRPGNDVAALDRPAVQRPAVPSRGTRPASDSTDPASSGTAPAAQHGRSTAQHDGSTLLLDDPTREVCTAVATGVLSPARLAIIAPGGHGKTAVLDHLARGCERHGIPVSRFGNGSGHGDSDSNAAHDTALMLVDDAHELTDADLARLCRLSEDERTGLVIAARPWPRPQALNTVLARLRGQIVLRPLDRRRITALLGRARAGLAEYVHTQTQGVPGLAARLATALETSLSATGSPGAAGSAQSSPSTSFSSSMSSTPPPLSASALAEFRPDLDRLTPDTLVFLLAASAGAGLDVDLLAGLLDSDPDGVARTIEAARAGGLLAHDGTPLPLVTRVLTALVPEERRLAVSQRLVRLQLDRGGPVLGLVTPLLGSGLSGTEPAEAFETAADEASAADPALAARLYSAAAAAGRSTGALGARWAEAAARAGDLDTALRLADQVIAAPDATDRTDGARTAATALTHRGQLARAAELYRWSGTRSAGGHRPAPHEQDVGYEHGRSGTKLSRVYTAVGLLGTGRLDEARRLLAEPGTSEPPTLLSGAMSALARGVLESVTGTPTAALSTLADAAETLEPVGRSLFLPDTPAAVGALVGIQGGELGIAETLLDRALAAGIGGPTFTARHTLLLAWIAMVRGETDLATRRLRSVGTDLVPRDWLLAVGLRAGLARRSSDLGALRSIWSEACEAVIRHRVDLFTLLPFGEFAVAAARLGDRDRLSHHLRQAGELVRGLGDPPLWAGTLHWSGLHAAIMADQRAEAAEHVDALTHDAEHSRYHAAVAEAARCWLDVLGGTIDPARVEAAAKSLRSAGLRWDAARLAGQAAIRTTDRAAMVTLLECARTLQGSSAQGTAQPSARPGTPVLSDRERQVAELVVAGMTYKQVGDRLFISAKTVEHHMARMRQRLGATSRSDLLAQLRELVDSRSGAGS